MDTKITPVISEQEQTGKTTKIIDIGKIEQDTHNNIFLPYGRKIVLADFLSKAAGNLKNIVDRNDINRLCKAYSQGSTLTYNFADLLNATVLTELSKLVRWKNVRPINMFPDEADTLALGEHAKDKKTGCLIQKDSLFWNFLKSNSIKHLYPISASWWDWLWQPIEFESAIVIDPYEGFKGIDETTFIIRDKEFYEAVRVAIEEEKPVPQQFLNDVLSYPNSMIDIDTRTKVHTALAKIHPEVMGEVNYLRKQLHKPIIVGGHSLSRSLSLPQHIMMYSRRRYGNRAEINQHLGRPNGPREPIIFLEEEVVKYRKEDLKFKRKAIEEKVFDKTIEDRIKWAESQEIYNPFNFPSPKAKPNRVINGVRSSITKNRGNLENLTETREVVWLGPNSISWWDNPSTWTGHKPGLAIKKALSEQHPHINIKGLEFKTMMNDDEFTKFRGTKRSAAVRVGKIPDRPGWAYVHIQIGAYKDGCSVFNEKGDIVLYSKNGEVRGNIEYEQTESGQET